MNDNLTAIAVVLDSSGSMAPLTHDTIGGLNTFLAEQRKLAGNVLFTLCTFSDHPTLVHDCIPLTDVKDITEETYKPSGWTALLDAVGTTIDSMEKKFAAMQESERPSKVIVMVQTDGQENNSSRYNQAKIKEMLDHQTNKCKWTFVYLGSHADSFADSKSMGFTPDTSIQYKSTGIGTANVYSNVSRSIGTYRLDTSAGATFDTNILKNAIENDKIISPTPEDKDNK
jgi:uncharacterized protein YegL